MEDIMHIQSGFLRRLVSAAVGKDNQTRARCSSSAERPAGELCRQEQNGTGASGH